MGVEDIPKLLKAVKTVDKVAEAAKITEASRPLIVNFRGTRYKFPAGTSEQEAKQTLWNKVLKPEMVKNVENVDAPATLPKERLAALEQSEKDLAHARNVIAELEKRKDLEKVSPGMYRDPATDIYWRVTDKGTIERAHPNAP